MKGISTWIFVVGSVILGMLLFTVSAVILTNQMELAQKQLTVEQLTDLYKKVKRTCTSAGIGESYYYNVNLPEGLRAVYAANRSDELPPDKVSVFISNRDSAEGKYFCFQFFSENLPRCEDMECYANFTYFGTPSLKNDLMSLIARLASGIPTYKYVVNINKSEAYFLTIGAVPKV